MTLTLLAVLVLVLQLVVLAVLLRLARRVDAIARNLVATQRGATGERTRAIVDRIYGSGMTALQARLAHHRERAAAKSAPPEATS